MLAGPTRFAGTHREEESGDESVLRQPRPGEGAPRRRGLDHTVEAERQRKRRKAITSMALVMMMTMMIMVMMTVMDNDHDDDDDDHG